MNNFEQNLLQIDALKSSGNPQLLLEVVNTALEEARLYEEARELAIEEGELPNDHAPEIDVSALAVGLAALQVGLCRWLDLEQPQ